MPKIPIIGGLLGDMPDGTQNIVEIAKELGISKSIIMRLINSGTIKSWTYLGRYIYCYKQEVIEALKGRENTSEGDD